MNLLRLPVVAHIVFVLAIAHVLKIKSLANVVVGVSLFAGLQWHDSPRDALEFVILTTPFVAHTRGLISTDAFLVAFLVGTAFIIVVVHRFTAESVE